MNAHKRPHVLYVEDDETCCNLMKEILEIAKIDITCACGMVNALLLPDKEKFDLFLIDLWLNDGDGNDLCVKLRNDHPAIPVVFYTGCASDRDRAEGLASGAAAYLVKPYSDLVVPTILDLTAKTSPAQEREKSAIASWREGYTLSLVGS